MKRIIKSILLIIAGMSAPSCSFMDREPDFVTPDYYYNTEAELLQALNGVYNRLIDTNGRMYSKGMFGFFALSDEFSYTNSFLENNIRHGVFDAAHLDIGRLWEILYEGVNRANYLIASFDGKDMEAESATKRAVLGEALFMRGYYNFLLTTMFGEVPLKLTPTTDPNDKYLARSSYQAIYDAVIKDMTDAEKLVFDIDKLGTNERISVTGVQAMLARVYLKMAGAPLTEDPTSEQARKYYDQALFYANEVISSGKHELNSDYSKIFINQVQNKNEIKECIWEVGMYGNKIGAEDLAGSVGVENGILCRDEKTGYSGGPMTVQKTLFDKFGEGDLRRDWAIADYQYNYDSENDVTTKTIFDLTADNGKNIWKLNPGKWRRDVELGNKAKLYTGTNFPLMRYSDVLLMKAEALNALEGPVGEAYDAVNQVRRRAYGKPVNTPDETCDLPSGLDQDEFQLQVEDERFRELCFEGQRKWDLIRWNKYIKTMQDLSAYVLKNAPADRQYAARAGKNTSERNILFPIPNTELTVNKLITQNPGW